MFDFTKEFTLKGKWWIPDESKNENDGLYGELSFSPVKGLTLLIEGSLFQTSSILKAKNNFELPCLFGVIKDRQFITLFDVFGNELGQDSWITTELSIEYGLLCDEGYFAGYDMPIKGLNFNLNCFAPFFKGFRKTLQLNHQETSVSFTYDEVPTLQVIKNSIDAHFVFSYQFKGLGMVADEFSFNEKIYFNIFYENPVSVAEVIRKLNFYRDFFTFFSSVKASFYAVNIFTPNDKGESVKFSFLFKDPANSTATRVSGLDVLLTYNELSGIFPAIFQHWLDNEQTIQSGLLLYLQTKHLQFPSQIQSFLNLAFALETLHNTFFGRKIFSPDESKKFKEQRNEAMKVFDETYRSKVMECLSHYNSVSFSERMKELIIKNQELIGDFIYDTDDFCRRIKQQRNFLAHNHSEENRAAISAKHYSYFIAMMRLIFECSFLPVLGMSQDLIRLSIKRNYLYQHFKNTLSSIKVELLKG